MGKGKSILRKEYLDIRNKLPEAERTEASEIITDKILKNTYVTSSECIFLFASVKNEVSTANLIDKLLSLGKKVAIPKVNEKDMDFYLIKGNKDLAPGFKDIPEPLKDNSDLVTPNKNAVLIMPGVAFDRQGNRIGYGGGYYDRYLARFKKKHPRKIGICYDIQYSAKRLPTDLHDTRVDMIITEKREKDFKNKNVFAGFFVLIADFFEDFVYELLRD